jgi:hypothetical protein
MADKATQDEAVEKIVAILTEVIGDADTFESRDEGRNLMMKASDTWMRRTEGGK